MITVIACVDSGGGIGREGAIPWCLPPDMKYFRQRSIGGAVIMGRKTFQSMGCRQLRHRRNIVVSSTQFEGVITYSSFEEAIQFARTLDMPICAIGGSMIYEQAMDIADVAYITRIDADYECDTFFPMRKLLSMSKEAGAWRMYNDIKYRFEIYIRA